MCLEIEAYNENTVTATNNKSKQQKHTKKHENIYKKKRFV